MEETRTLSMHPALLLDVIKRQAGTLSKAILELVMNSADADATHCKIDLCESMVTVCDNGSGFLNRETIEKFFETFGEPHTEAEQKKFGVFRMGRGQAFSYGKNDWRSGDFRMILDIKEWGLDYKLHTLTKKHPGCDISIELYDKLYPSQIAQTITDLKLWCRWMPLEVSLNGAVISNDPGQFDWTLETDEAYIEIDGRQSLEVYNLGCHVKPFPKYTFGVGGEIVSKKQLQVNFARNDIMSQCPVWKKILPIVNERAKARNLNKKTSLDDAGRQHLAYQAKSGELKAEEWQSLPIFTAVTGRHVHAGDLAKMHDRITNAPKGDRLGDTIHRQGVAFVLADETLERFGMGSMIEMLNWLKLNATSWSCVRRLTYVPYETLSKGMKLTYEIIPETKYTADERIWLDLIQRAMPSLRLADEDSERYDRVTFKNRKFASDRRICLGQADAAAGWTDAMSYIAINRDFLRKHKHTLRGYAKVGALLLHECCHRQPSLESHDHDQNFYELFHDSSPEFVATFVNICFDSLPSILDRHKKKLTRQMLRQRDKAVEASRRTEELESISACPLQQGTRN